MKSKWKWNGTHNNDKYDLNYDLYTSACKDDYNDLLKINNNESLNWIKQNNNNISSVRNETKKVLEFSDIDKNISCNKNSRKQKV